MCFLNSDFFQNSGFFLKNSDVFKTQGFFETKFFIVLNNAHVIYLLTMIAGSKKMNMSKMVFICFMLHVPLDSNIIKSVIASGRVSLWVSSISWDTE